ncbi:T9SS type A sorting domain-containing protein [candidate division KSB1 bacterium]|nr:T9SS type A sorting domain-containing protein [candidate division KSB1 bacterium]
MFKIQQSLFLYFAFRRKYLVLNLLLFSFLFAATAFSGQVKTGAFNYGGVSRSYIVFLPQGYDESKHLPVVINLHSDGKNAQWHSNYTRMNSIADTAGFIVVYPNAYYSSVAGYVSFNQDAIISSIVPKDPDTRDVGFIDALIDTLHSHYRIELDRIYAAGLSGGGYLAFKMACQISDRLAAIAAVGPEFSVPTANNCTNLRTAPLLYFFGTKDPIIPYATNAPSGWYNGEQILNFWINHNNCFEADTTSVPDLDPNDGCTVEKMTFQNGNDNSKVIFYKINNGGHTWPGTADIPSEAWVAKTTRDINASVEIWNFFKSYRLSQFSTPQHDLKVKVFPKQVIKAPIFANNFINTVGVRNGGANDEFGFSVSCDIDSAGILVYSKTQIIDTLKRFENEQITFQNWHTFEAQTYSVSCYTSLLNDENLSNDTLKTSIIVSNLIDDFENGIGRWQSDNRWVVTQSNASNGKLSLKSSQGNYVNNIDSWVEYKSGFDLSQLREAHISYYTWYAIQLDHDFGYVQASADGGQTWQQLGNPYTGTVDSWKKDTRSLTAFCGPGFTDVRIRFRLVTDATGVASGWYLDDIKLFPYEAQTAVTKEEISPVSQQFILYDNYPNPFNAQTIIEYQLPHAGGVKLMVYNLLGQEIKTIIDRNLEAGRFNLIWDGKDNLGQVVPSGVYFYRIQAEGFVETKKMLLLQ